jgi:hypothetical protein
LVTAAGTEAVCKCTDKSLALTEAEQWQHVNGTFDILSFVKQSTIETSTFNPLDLHHLEETKRNT